jgi:RNA polymerase sigma-70 factor (ECF subfamily)
VPATITKPDLPQSLTDEQVVSRVLGGESALFELVMRRYNQRVYRAVRSIVQSNEEAEDVMQEAYVSAYTHLGDFAFRAQLSTWLVKIAVHEAFARKRRAQRFAPLDAADPEDRVMVSSTRNPEQRVSDHELGGILERAIDDLPEGFRTVFVLRAVEQLSVTETAEALGVPEDTVKTRLHRARGLLRTALIDRVGTALPSVFDFHQTRCDRVVGRVLERIRGAS